MAIVTRYFSTSGNGDADGTTWEKRAALFDGSNTWSAVIDDFDHTSNSLLCYIGPGNYTCAEALSDSVSGATAYNPITLHGCDSNGNPLTPPDPDWCSAQPEWDTSGMPVITTASNIITISTGIYVICRFINFVATGRTGGAVIAPSAHSVALDWCIVDNQTNNSSAAAVAVGVELNNCVLKCSGTSYSAILGSSYEGLSYNVRLEGNASASSGNRYGYAISGNNYARLQLCTIINCIGGGVISAGTSTTAKISMRRCTIIGNTAGGVIGNETASQTRMWHIDGCMITGNGGYGIDVNNGLPFVSNTRLRDNTTSNFADMGNYPETFGNDVTDTYASQTIADAAEFVNAAAGDYRIKASSHLWGKGYGAGDEIVARARFNNWLKG